MIELRNVDRYYTSLNGSRHYVYKNLNLKLPEDRDIAILGKNGAGKSTLIKLIGGIESPDRGEIISDSTISWPLGLSSGLLRDSTGRENVDFVCRIYGVSNRERVHDFVVEFSELGKFYDERVGTYSSGMRSKLAFGLSICFDFDILLIDEVLSVGDSAFKKKCEKYLNEKRKTGTRILLVSHSMKACRDHCQSGIVVSNGQITYYDDIEDAISAMEEEKGNVKTN